MKCLIFGTLLFGERKATKQIEVHLQIKPLTHTTNFAQWNSKYSIDFSSSSIPCYLSSEESDKHTSARSSSGQPIVRANHVCGLMQLSLLRTIDVNRRLPSARASNSASTRVTRRGNSLSSDGLNTVSAICSRVEQCWARTVSNLLTAGNDSSTDCRKGSLQMDKCNSWRLAKPPVPNEEWGKSEVVDVDVDVAIAAWQNACTCMGCRHAV